MFMKLRDKYGEFNLFKLNNIIIIICYLLFIISLIFVKNIYLLIIMFLLILYISRYFDKTIIKLICSITALMIFGFVLINFIHHSFIRNNVFEIFRNIIKILYFLYYSFVLYYYYKEKKYYKEIPNYWTFRELRKKKYSLFEEKTKEKIQNYINENNIDYESDYFKLINNNFVDKTKNDLEKFIWINYLRFYKNKGLKPKYNLYDLVYLIIHVIIMVIVLIVR